MDYVFNLPDTWEYRESNDRDGYDFWLKADPTHTFSLTRTALAVYGDDPVQIVKIINMQMDMMEASKAARTAIPTGTPTIAPSVPVCTTPMFCAWEREHEPERHKQCYCRFPEQKRLANDRRPYRESY